ncbi:MAG: aromatic ring-hydroxylating dioxygenase subunit alpha [Blastocatellia bacterium]
MEFSKYNFDPRLAYSQTIPSDWYFSAEMLAAEKLNIFAKTWQLVGRLEQVATPGSYFTATIADEPVVIVRDKDSKIRAFSNVCRHRAGEVAKAAGKRNSFQCGYHGWTYSLAGKLLHCPEFDGVECFNKADYSLPEFQVEIWGQLIFVNLDKNSPSLATFLEDLPNLFAYHDLASLKLAARKDWYMNCNWKVYIDNYLEGYHIPIVHPGLNRELDYGKYLVETKKYYSIQHSPIRESAARLAQGQKDNSPVQYFWIFPNLLLNVYPDNYSTNLIIPLSPTKTLTVFEWYFRNPESEAVKKEVERVVKFSDEIQVEDIDICETVQRGLASQTYKQGRYSVKRENGVHHFHSLLVEYLGLK